MWIFHSSNKSIIVLIWTFCSVSYVLREIYSGM
jgi:hypothetical protein